MTRNDFITILYNNGQGLTLDQIKTIDDDLNETIPDGLIDDIVNTTGITDDEAIEQAKEQAREVYIDALAGEFTDPISVKMYFRNYEGINADLPDAACVGLFYAICARC